VTVASGDCVGSTDGVGSVEGVASTEGVVSRAGADTGTWMEDPAYTRALGADGSSR
jgi:hypothetical protein